MSDLCRLIWYAMAGFLRSRAALQAENLILRHQLNLLRHRSPKRVAVGNIDRFAVCRTLSHLPQGTRRAQNPQARDRPALASRGFSGVLALEITIVRRPAKDARGHSSAHSRDKRCQPAVGSAAGFTANYASLA